MKNREDYSLANDNQFYLWKISSISNWKKKDLAEPKREPLNISDAEALMDDLLFPHKSSMIRLRSIQLSLKQTRILTTLLPDEIINITDLKKNTLDSYVGVLLFADVSGFTALCEKYNDCGKNGTDKLTATLNNYIGAMVEVIYSHGGDVLKFSGDAFLALWKVKTNEYVYSVIHRVLSCALYIQHTLGLYETEAKVLLRVKLGISAGNVTFSVIGDDNSKNYLIVGSPVHEVKAAEHICSSGEVILSLSAWGHLSPVNYQHLWKDNDHIKVTRIIYDPENTKREVMRLDSHSSFTKLEILRRHLKNKDNFKTNLFKKHFSFSSYTFSEARLLIDDSSRKNLGSDLRTFVIPPVIQQIDADLPLEYLSEMRNVTSMFVNIIPQKLPTKVLIDMVDRAYTIISDLVYKAMGSVNKVSLFDKDVMLLIIFGLRGFNHEGEVAACLQCAYDIKQACWSLSGVSSVSVGVTTGQAYCGVVGHPLRREYTVIGASVNKAARIMVAYPGKVTCDRDTFLFSNLASSYFTLQEHKPLKGIESVGPIYEFTQEKRRNTWAAINEGMYPILGREAEMKLYQNILKNIEKPNCNERAILIRGSARVGKTRLMDEMILEAHKNGFQPIIIALHGIHSAIPYGTAQYIIRQILDIPDSANAIDKKRRLTLLLGDHITKTDLCYLNEIMNVKFPSSHEMDSEDPAEKFEKMKHLFRNILQVGTKSIIFAIDDIDFCDQLSWDLLMSAINERTKFLIMTMPKRPRPGISEPLKIPSKLDPHVVKMTLQGLSPKYLATLACQFLNAKAISPDLVSVLVSRSNGNPGWCESFLVSLCQSNTIIFDHLTLRHVRRLALITPPTILLTRTPYAVIMSPLEKTIRTDKPPDEKGDANNKKTSRPNHAKEKSFFDKIKTFQLHRRNARDESIVFSKTHPPSEEKILQAYEDLQQTIERLRVKNTTCVSPVICDVVSGDELLTEHIIAITEKAKEDETYDIFSSYPRRSKSSFDLMRPPAIASVGKICDDTELDFKLKEIFSRFPTKHRESQSNIRFQDPPTAVTQSLHGELYDKPERDVSMFCKHNEVHNFLNSKSAQALLNSKSIKVRKEIPREIESESDIKNDIKTTAAFFHIFFISFWKPLTEELIEESIKIFAENKKDSDKKIIVKKFEKSSKKTKNSSFTSFNGNKSANLGSIDYTERIKNIDVYSEMDITEPPPSGRKSTKSIGSGKNVQLGKILFHRSKSNISCESEKSLQEKFMNSEALDSSRDDLLESELESRKTDSIHTTKPISGSYSFSTHFSKNSKITIENKRRSWISKVCSWVVRRSEGTGSTDLSSMEVVEDDDEENIQAILINPSVKLEEVQTPEYFAGIIMSAFDCLSPYEQLMLKCGSIIGEKFTRKMLNALMHNPNSVLTSEGIKRLFEMRILCCGADSLQSLPSSSTENTPRCMCDLSYEELVDDMLPKYSFCRLLTFKYAMFRSTLYELLPLSQKKEFHIRAVEYLESENVICSSCDRPRWVFEVKSSNDFSEESLSKLFIEENSARRNAITSSHSRSLFKSITTLDSEQSVVIRHVKKLKQKRHESVTQFTLPTMLPDYRQCECLSLQADVHQQLIGHCVAAGLKLKHIKILISYSSIMISLGELDQASKVLKEAEMMIKSNLKGNDELLTSKKELKRLLGKINVLYGQVYLEKNELKKSSRCLISALKYFGSKFIPVAPFQCLQQWHENLVQHFHSKYPSIFVGRAKNKSENVKDTATCLSLLSNVFVLQGKWELASLVALRSLNNLQKSNSNLIELCNAYSNLIDIYRHFGRLNSCKVLEKSAAATCVKLFTGKSTLEMIALGRLISSVFNSRLMSGSLYAAAKLGDQVSDIGTRLSSKKLETYIIPQTVQVMIMIGKIRKSVSYIMELSNKDVWYNILCLDFILDTGFSIEDPNECYNGLIAALQKRDLPYETYLRALTSTCLWKIRTGKAFDSWSEKLMEVDVFSPPGDNFSSMMTSLKILEFHLLKFGEINPTDKSMQLVLSRKIAGMFESLERVSKKAPVILPRFCHLRAYYYYKTNNLAKIVSSLSQARKHCLNHGNLLEYEWISHNRKVWNNGESDSNKDYWVTCAKDNKYLKWTESEDVSSWRNVMYTLQ